MTKIETIIICLLPLIAVLPVIIIDIVCNPVTMPVDYWILTVKYRERKKKMTKLWWKAAGIRALKTVAQTMAATIGTSAVVSAVDWKIVISSGIVAGILSLLTSLAGLPEVDLAEKSSN